MSMSTVFALVKDSRVIAIADSLDASTALRELSYPGLGPGEIYACRLSDSAAREIRDMVHGPVRMNQPTPMQLLKRYSHYLQKCADVT